MVNFDEVPVNAFTNRFFCFLTGHFIVQVQHQRRTLPPQKLLPNFGVIKGKFTWMLSRGVFYTAVWKSRKCNLQGVGSKEMFWLWVGSLFFISPVIVFITLNLYNRKLSLCQVLFVDSFFRQLSSFIHEGITS